MAEKSNPNAQSSPSIDQINKSSNFLSIDILKGLMILLVIFDHAFPWTYKWSWGAAFWERISIPVFLILLGLNQALSFQKKGLPTGKSEWIAHFKHKIKRYLIPYLTLYIVSTIIGLLIYGNFETMLENQFDPHWQRGMLYYFIIPFYGPGNWFIPVLFQSVFILPLLYMLYQKTPRKALLFGFLWDLGIQLFVFFVYGHWIYWWPNQPITHNMLQCSFLFYFSAPILGFWLVQFLGSSKPEIVVPLAEVENSITETIPDSTALENAPTDNFPPPNHMRPTNDFHTRSKISIIFNLEKWDLVSCALFGLFYYFIILPYVYLYLPFWAALSVGIFLMFAMFISKIFPKEMRWKVFLGSILLVGLFIGAILIYNNSTDLNTEEGYLTARTDLFLLISFCFLLPLLIYLKFHSNSHAATFFIWAFGLLSAIYLAIYSFSSIRFYEILGDYNFFVFPYSFLLVILGIQFLPTQTTNSLLKTLQLLGKASYHILLSQILVYGIIMATLGDHYFQEPVSSAFPIITESIGIWFYYALNILISCSLGVTWYRIEQKK